ncbi:GNAT family N-acetyltransferase [Aquisalinus flavus]|uniref:BioF2-like acetyltransferase domain-containing protein n=1 Tax=Aquisalinus flavus TaxID=1526572 RepID=A0A8J2V2X8_9PROT|nr:GNAT family N-acetyltransferase [Aquisalinus flavus]MBD0426340.1 GNAT family N-acetyltransferase [Aquisalinus flavus]GGD08762.1 hypothetical protein GCM10011342_16970 [Aquisalinus flavus]
MGYSDRERAGPADGVRILPFSHATIASLRSDWEDLAASAGDPNVFLEPWFAQAALEIIAADEADIAAFLAEGRLIGLVIFARDASYAHLPLDHYRSHLHAHQFLATPLVRRGCEGRFAAMLTAWLDSAPAAVSFCRLTHMSEAAAIRSALEAYCLGDNRRCDIVHRCHRPAIDASQDADSYLESHISSRRKKRLRRLGRRLAEMGEVRFEQLQDADQLERWLDEFLTLERKGWKGEEGTAITCRPGESVFFRQLAAAAMGRGQLVFSRLTVDGKGVAYAFDLRSADRIFCLKVAYDADFSRFSPGMQLEFHCLQTFLGDPSIRFVDSCAASGNTSLEGLWVQSVSIVQMVVARKGLRYGLPLTAARLLEQASAAGARIIRPRQAHRKLSPAMEIPRDMKAPKGMETRT